MAALNVANVLLFIKKKDSIQSQNLILKLQYISFINMYGYFCKPNIGYQGTLLSVTTTAFRKYQVLR